MAAQAARVGAGASTGRHPPRRRALSSLQQPSPLHSPPAAASDAFAAHPPVLAQAHGGDPLIPFSGALEAKLLDMPEDEREVYCKEVSSLGKVCSARWV